MNSGWQQPEVRSKDTCRHTSLISAIFTMGRHPAGHVWRCVCGKEFVVTLRDDGTKMLKAKE